MVKISSVDYIAQLIQEKFEDTPFKIVHKSRNKDNTRILQNSMMVVAIDKSGIIKTSFHVAVRSDVVYQIILKLKEIPEVKSVETSVFYYDVKGLKMYYGLDAEKKMLADLKFAIINEFMIEQTQLMMLKNLKSPYVC